MQWLLIPVKTATRSTANLPRIPGMSCERVDRTKDSRQQACTELFASPIPAHILQSLALARLSSKKKSLGVLSPATDFERAEILVPIAFWGFGLRFSPEFQLVNILSGYLTLL